MSIGVHASFPISFIFLNMYPGVELLGHKESDTTEQLNCTEYYIVCVDVYVTSLSIQLLMDFWAASISWQ